MEIDLNNVEGGVEKRACGNGGECGKGGNCGCGCCYLSTSTSSCTSNASSGSLSSPYCSVSAPSSSTYMELWHACAGPLTSLPHKGNVVVYFPQGHLEQVNSVFPAVEMPTFDLSPQIFCRVVEIHLHANKENDEVYAQLTLLPLPELLGLELDGKEKEDEGIDTNEITDILEKSTPHMFCKTLTASDTSTHGGFSVPRRAAEDCFPPLDYKQQRPSQELIAKDLHGVEWKFKHIYRGQPRRHLLTTGWSNFVSRKNLASGDAVLFLRGEDGDLRLGIRRAARAKNGLPDSITKNQNYYPNVLAPVANALSTNGTFKVFYSPRASQADFIIPYRKYLKCIANQTPAGTRFKVRLKVDGSAERRFAGVVMGVSDAAPYRWPNSKWKCLTVRWDENILSNDQERVSPWDIDASGNGPFLDFEESVRSSMVFQGQENGGLLSPSYRSDMLKRKLDFEMQHCPFNPLPTRLEKINYGKFVTDHAPTTFTAFLESNWFPKVLQGQEICSLRSLVAKTDWNISAWSKPEPGHRNAYNIYHRLVTPGFYPLASEGARSILFASKTIHGAGQGHLLPSSPFKFQTANHTSSLASVLSEAKKGNDIAPRPANEPKASNVACASGYMHLKKTNDGNQEKVPVCKLFGYNLTEDPTLPNLQVPSKRSTIKVHKQGSSSVGGDHVDLSRLHGYSDLLAELEQLFSMKGLLSNPKYGWHILYTDSDNDTMVVGDDPWHEFVEVVNEICICTKEEAEKLDIGINSDDTQSCLEETPPSAHVLKSPFCR